LAFQAGDTFIHARATGLLPHLWAIISDTERSNEQVVIVSLTTWSADKDASCTLEAGDHPLVTRRTCVSYRDARIVTTADLVRLEQQRLIDRREPLTPGVLDRIRAGAGCSPFIKIQVRQFLDEQHLL
jgi:hypothetical protein